MGPLFKRGGAGLGRLFLGVDAQLTPHTHVCGLVVGQEKDVSLFLDRTGEPAMQHRDSSRLKNEDTSFS